MADESVQRPTISETEKETTEGTSDDVQSLLKLANEEKNKGNLDKALLISWQIINRFKDQGNSEIVKSAEELVNSISPERAKSEMGPLSTIFIFLLGMGVWVVIGFGIAAIFSDSIRQAWSDNWGVVPIGFAVAGIGLWISRLFEKKLASKPEAYRRNIVTLTMVPLITVSMLAVITLGATGMAFVLEIIFILLASLIPAAAYYLFLTARRPSILNEFIANLSRLGLLSPRPVRRVVTSKTDKYNIKQDRESPKERHSRIEGYFQRFEAIYGDLRFTTTSGVEETRAGFVKKLVKAIDNTDVEIPTPQASMHISDMFRPNLIIPIGIASMLTTLGWLLVMQPDFYTFKSEIKKQDTTEVASVDSPAKRIDDTKLAGTFQDTSPADEAGVLERKSKPSIANEETSNTVIAELTLVWTPVGLTFLGAYFFGIQMIFRRFVRRDLGPAAYLALSNRIILSIISVWIVLAAYAAFQNDAAFGQSLLNPETATASWPPIVMVIAFVVGVFPRVLWQFITAAFTKLPGIKIIIPAVEAKQPLSDLDGLTIWHESRLEEEDVENVPNMATIDIVDVMLHTQIPAERLICWVDQAILLVALGPKIDKDQNKDKDTKNTRDKVFGLGLRTASQVVSVFLHEGKERQALSDVFGENAMYAFVRALKYESNFDLVWSWRNVAIDQEEELTAVSMDEEQKPESHHTLKNLFKPKESKESTPVPTS